MQSAVDMSLINCEINLILIWSENCVITSKATRDATYVTLKLKDRKLYVPVVTLSTKYDNKLFAQLKTWFKKTIKWNKYRSEMTKQIKTNNLNYLVDPTFNKVNRLFVLLFKNEEDDTSFSKYYTPTVEIKDFNEVYLIHP